MHPTLLLSIEELPFVQSIGYEGAPGTALAVTATGVPPAARQPLDIGAVPVFDTDNSGIAAHDVDLSRHRAEAVVRQLVAGGIDAARLQAAGKGAAAPLADNKDEAGRAKNRRVELVKL